ncbi:MAG: hypothetical protein H7281_01835 [Bacteriovorax sp.]|nr:hypothetical protein [Bacteriovorax sp.]
MSNSLIKVSAAAEKPREELMVVQTVSSDRRSFVMAKGVKDGVMRGQEIIYANENVSILCKAVEVNRNYSLWTPVDKNVNVPFNKEEFISYNSHAYGNVALDIVGDIYNLTPEVNYDILFKKFRTSDNFSLKASFDQGLSQSSSDVSADKNSKRSGYTFALEYNFRFLPEFEINTGGRIDNEVYRLSNPNLDIPTSRVMATVAATYHFVAFSKDKNNFYLTLAAGIGKSTTTISDEKSTGVVTLLPEARFGYLMPFSNSVAMIFEGSVESLSAHESFQNGTTQVTNILNAKITIGLRF